MKFLCLPFLFLVNFPTPSTPNGGEEIWKTLAKVQWSSKFEPVLGIEVQVPAFSEEVKALEGKEIVISGFAMPIDSEADQLIISALPFATCFFFGKAGPETVLQTDLKRKKSWINEKVTLKGKLKINREDVLGLIYYLEEAEFIKVEK